MSEVQRAESFKNEVALNVQEISSGLPLLSMTEEISFADDEDLTSSYARCQGGG
jgi:hypothetical protein